MATRADRKRTDYTGVIIVALLAPIALLSIHLGREDIGRSVCIVLGMVMLAIRVRWDLRKRVWFWGVIVIVLVLHVPLFFLFRWPRGVNGWVPAIGALPIGIADVLVILGAVSFVERLMTKAPPFGGT